MIFTHARYKDYASATWTASRSKVSYWLANVCWTLNVSKQFHSEINNSVNPDILMNGITSVTYAKYLKLYNWHKPLFHKHISRVTSNVKLIWIILRALGISCHHLLAKLSVHAMIFYKQPDHRQANMISWEIRINRPMKEHKWKLLKRNSLQILQSIFSHSEGSMCGTARQDT